MNMKTNERNSIGQIKYKRQITRALQWFTSVYILKKKLKLIKLAYMAKWNTL